MAESGRGMIFFELVSFAQLASQSLLMSGTRERDQGEIRMFTSAECRARAEAILAQAESDGRHGRRLITAAEGWLHLASQLRRVEVVGTIQPEEERGE
jgi:hypothetical protein